MVEKFGSDQQQLANLGGGVISQDSAVLINGDSDGESALLFGPAALREIQAGVANGDFSIPPSDATANITTDNALPYWTFTDVNSAGAITAALVADTGAASGYVLRFTVNSGTLTGKSATLTRFVPVASSASRSFSFYAEATFESGTASTQSQATLSGQFYKSDQTTTTGSPITSDNYTFSSLVGATGITAPDLYAVAPDLTTMTAPADAAFLKLTITIATVATQSAVRTVDLTEVRLAHGLPELLITDRDDPTNPPAIINAAAGELNVQSGSGDYLLLSATTILNGSDSVSLLSGGTIELQAAAQLSLIGTPISTTGEIQATAISDGHYNLNRGVILQRGALTITTTTMPVTPSTSNTQSVTWATNIKQDTGMWTTGALINLPNTGVYVFTINSRFTAGSGYSVGLYVFQNSTLKYHTREDASTTSAIDAISLSGAIYATSGDTLQVRVAATTSGKTLSATGWAPQLSVVYQGNWA